VKAHVFIYLKGVGIDQGWVIRAFRINRRISYLHHLRTTNQKQVNDRQMNTWHRYAAACSPESFRSVACPCMSVACPCMSVACPSMSVACPSMRVICQWCGICSCPSMRVRPPPPVLLFRRKKKKKEKRGKQQQNSSSSYNNLRLAMVHNL